MATTYIDYGALSASLNVLQMLTTAAELTNGTNAINVTVGARPADATSLISRWTRATGKVAYGPTGTTATTGQGLVRISR